MARLKDTIAKMGGSTDNLFKLPVESFDPNPNNMRLDRQELRDHIRALADDIKAYGYDQTRPLTIRMVEDRAVVQDGNCRLMAVRIAIEEGAEIKRLPCIAEIDKITEADALVRMATRNTSLPHSPTEYAAIIQRFRAWGWTDSEIAKRLQKSRQWVVNTLEAASMPADVQALVAEGAVSETLARQLTREEGSGAAERIVKARENTGRTRITARHLRVVEAVAEPVEAVAEAPAERVEAPAEVMPDEDFGTDLHDAVVNFLMLHDHNGTSDQIEAAVDMLRRLVGGERERVA